MIWAIDKVVQIPDTRGATVQIPDTRGATVQFPHASPSKGIKMVNGRDSVTEASEISTNPYQILKYPERK